jgi:uncharacterized membrane protein (UPF0127 family)
MSVHSLAVQARLLARNVDNGEIVAHRVASATRRLDRAVGLLTRRGLEPGEALWIVPCRGVHTCGMRFAIDIVALDRSGTVVDLVGDLRPWRIRLPRNGTSSVLELAAGSLAKLKTKLGHRIALEVHHEGHEDLTHEGHEDHEGLLTGVRSQEPGEFQPLQFGDLVIW